MEEAGGEGKAAGVEEAGPGRGCQVEIVRWRWRGGRYHRIKCEEWRHPGSVKIYGKTMSLLIGPDTTFKSKGSALLIGPETTFNRKGSVSINRARHYIYKEGKCTCQ